MSTALGFVCVECREMSEDKPTTEECRRAWDAMASHWDEEMEAGRTWQRSLIQPAVERLLELRAGERVLEIGCGNGELARRMAALGAKVLATDFSAAMLERARARGGDIDYRVADGTSREQLLALASEGSFDVCVCNMAIMDMPEIKPLAGALRQLLRAGGRFVFSIQHPAFNGGGGVRMIEELDDERGVHYAHSVKVSRYIRPRVSRGVALSRQPEAQWYFDRPLSAVLKVFFEGGLVLDGLKEPVFEPSQVEPGSASAVFVELPPVLVARLRV